MTAREDIAAVLLNGGAATNAFATGLLDAYRAEVLAETRTSWPSATELQKAAATKRASGAPEDIAIANLLNEIANSLAWLAPYRSHEGGYGMWGAATTVAQLINGTVTLPAPDFFQPGHGYTHRDGTDFLCVTVTDHPGSGERLAIGWRTDVTGLHFLTYRHIGHWLHDYDGCKPPEDTAYASTRGEPGDGA